MLNFLKGEFAMQPFFATLNPMLTLFICIAIGFILKANFYCLFIRRNSLLHKYIFLIYLSPYFSTNSNFLIRERMALGLRWKWVASSLVVAPSHHIWVSSKSSSSVHGL